jgi:hypothetical protein
MARRDLRKSTVQRQQAPTQLLAAKLIGVEAGA